MPISDTFTEDMLANAILGTVLILYFCMRDLCKRVSHSDCAYDCEKGLQVKLPTWRAPTSETDL